jgi:hypothetical protein
MDWVYVQRDAPRHVVRSNEIGKLVHWGLVKQKPGEGTSARTSGLWKPTEFGIAFALGKVGVSSHIHLYNNIMVGMEDSTVMVREALGDKFDYDELMRAR